MMIYDDRERRLEALAVPPLPRREVIDELYAAVVDGLPRFLMAVGGLR